MTATSRRRIRDLPLLWKLLLPFLVIIIVVGAAGTFLIVRDLATDAQAALDQDLARHSLQARSVVRDRELYLVESANFATNIQGMPAAIERRDGDAVARLLGSVLALKTDLTLLVATDARGTGLVELRRAPDTVKAQRDSGDAWARHGFVRRALDDRAAGKHAGFLVDGGDRLLAIAWAVCDQPSPCRRTGAVIAAFDVGRLASEAAGKATGRTGNIRAGIAIFDDERRLLAASGSGPRTPAPAPAPDGGLVRLTNIEEDTQIATLYAPFEIQGRPVGQVSVSLPTRPVFAGVRGTAFMLGFVVLAVMAGVVAVGALLSRFILAQVRPLVATNREIGAGTLTARAPVLSRDELGELAEGVNQMATQLQASYETLELRVAQRTEEVRRLLQERTEFFAAISHDLRTPLAVIRSQAKMMLDPAYEQSSKTDAAKTIASSSDQLLGLINELLELSRAEAGRLAIEMQDLKLRDVVRDLRPTIQGLADGGGLKVTVSIPRDLPVVRADPQRLREIIINLVDNAVKYTPPGGHVGISAIANNGHVEMRVRDTGIGIPVEDQDKIFEPFCRIKANAPQRGQPSTGLGLALTRRLVEAQGGTIAFSSEPAQGSTFSFTLTPARAGSKPSS